MGKVTSKLQVTVPKALAEQYGIEPGDEIAWEAAGDVIRVVPAGKHVTVDVKARVRIFDQATARQRAREKKAGARRAPKDRGWTREDLYDRGRGR
jgi:bifunctional DNA-binding transcriptional regulator/antitoxin component of YhaV-PrlF toxin-antitoxin module